VLIPAIDLMAGEVVQLIQGERVALRYADVDDWARRFAGYPLVQVIDLDAAKGQGDNRELVARLAARMCVQVGGGLRTVEAAQACLETGAERVIVGSALFRAGRVDTAFAARLSETVGHDRLLCAVDSRGGCVVTQAWRERTSLGTLEAMRALEPWCGGFLSTHTETEGLMGGIPLEVVRRLREGTRRRLIVAGGIASDAEVAALDKLGVDAVVGMALYSGSVRAEGR
jgi:phosphoribosylformimino-5-aminoimidazole carboxamide ribotide isomerase